jgi:hypothetical protein
VGYAVTDEMTLDMGAQRSALLERNRQRDGFLGWRCAVCVDWPHQARCLLRSRW